MRKNYVDLQVNGYAGVDFNSDGLTAEMLHGACQRLRSDGVAGILATIITAAPENMFARLKNLAALRSQDSLAQELIWGIHIEGPFISPAPGFVGAHPAEHVQPANIELMQRLLDAADGLVRMVTLAPEHDAEFKVTKLLAHKTSSSPPGIAIRRSMFCRPPSTKACRCSPTSATAVRRCCRGTTTLFNGC